MKLRPAKRARRIGTYKGKPVYVVPVIVYLNDSRLCRTVETKQYDVVAHSADDAAAHMQQEWMHRPETEIYAFGVNGGTARRFVSWEAAIGHELMQPASAAARTIDVNFEEPTT